jgi:hypothetical protein
MAGSWIVAVMALVVALAALAYARHTARRLAHLTHMYWQLKFEHGELKAKVDPPTPAAPEPTATFVPLTRLRPPSPTAAAGQAPRDAGSAQDH